MRYTNSSIDRVREADIVKTIENYVPLKKEGSNYKGSSPFANEKTPSFVVSPAKQIFKCFSSGIGGDGITFVTIKENVEFIEAIEIIAKIHNIFLEKEEESPEQKRKQETKDEMFHLLNEASRKYVQSFKKLEANHWAKELISGREFTDETCIDFQIGYAPLENALTKWAMEKGTLSIAKDLGLSDTQNNASFDKFKNRIIFPIHNDKGTVVGFGGRRSNSEEDAKFPKYLNSKESTIYIKSDVLYGLFQAKKAIGKSGTVILTEGYTDVISMFQNGCENTVASCGTALTDNHAQLLKKYAEEVILLRDGDKAGQKATIKDIDICLINGLNVSLCELPEGEDPDSFARLHKNEMNVWIQQNKKDALLWKVEQYDIERDYYQSDIDTINEVALLNIGALKSEFINDETMATLKGDALREAKEFNRNLREEINLILKESKQEITNVAKIDPTKKSEAFQEICKTLLNIKQEVKRTEYIKLIAKTFDVTVGTLKTEIGNLERKETENKEKTIGVPATQNLRLPKGADKEEYMQHGFVTVDNSYWFQRSDGGGFFQGTNYGLQPLFHILGDKENKRLCEITNQKGKKKLIDFDSDMLANFAEFRKYLFRIGGFMWLTHNGVRTEHFDKFVYRFDDMFEPALELLTMGWNKKGFFAFADGVFWEGKFRGVNKYGIMHLEGIDTAKTEYNQKIDYYYSPAFSVMHADNQDGDDKYENDRTFVYKESGITLLEWQEQMILVFQEKGMGGILFNFASIFRDLFLENYDSFPLMGGFGEKDSGKSGFGKILQNFFYYRLPALDLTQATHVGFSRRLSRNVNTVQFLDEYQDKQCDEKIFSGMMGAWNGIGREKGMNSGDKRTQYDKINSAIYYAGQFMPTRMENALATRTISWLFQSREFSSTEKENFSKLLNWTNSGVSSLVVDVVQHRAYFESNLTRVHTQTVRDLKEALEAKEYQGRIFDNTAMLLTTYRILKDKIKFPFTDKAVEAMCMKLIIENSEQITDSNGLTEFWSIIQFLFETSILKEDNEFTIEQPIEFKVLGENKTEFKYTNPERKKILFLRLKSVYQFYNKEVSKREGVDVIGQTTLRQYFKSRSYFIGLIKGRRFGTAGSQSCYAFDYEAMVEMGLLTIEKDMSIENKTTTASTVTMPTIEVKEDDIPF